MKRNGKVEILHCFNVVFKKFFFFFKKSKPNLVHSSKNFVFLFEQKENCSQRRWTLIRKDSNELNKKFKCSLWMKWAAISRKAFPSYISRRTKDFSHSHERVNTTFILSVEPSFETTQRPTFPRETSSKIKKTWRLLASLEIKLKKNLHLNWKESELKDYSTKRMHKRNILSRSLASINLIRSRTFPNGSELELEGFVHVIWFKSNLTTWGDGR